MRAALATPLAAAALFATVLSGCGGSSPSGTSAGPATATPASAALYVEAVVKPEGALQSNAEAVGRALTGRHNPYNNLLKLLAGPTGKTPNYASEVQPWLGTRAGAFLSPRSLASAQGLVSSETLTKIVAEGLGGLEAALLGKGGLPSALAASAPAALVLDTSDVEKAKSFLEGQAHSAGAHAVSYRGVTYQVSSSGIAEGVVHKLAVIGSEAGMKSVIDTTAGGPSLSKVGAYSKLASTAEQGALANVYVDPSAVEHAIAGGVAGSIVPLFNGLLGNPAQAYLSAIPSSSSLALDLDTLPPTSSGNSGATSALEGGAQVVRELPGTSWLALGIGNLGTAVGRGGQGLGVLGSLGSALNLDGIDFGALLAPLRSHSLNLQRDLFSWAGATGIYASGASVLELRAAAIVDSSNPTRSRAAVGQFAKAYREAGAETASTHVPGTETAMAVKLPNFPLEVVLAAGKSKFIAGLGAPSIEEALNPQSVLGSAPAYGAATNTLGQGLQPSVLIEFHTLSGLLESIGLNQSPGFAGVASAIAPLGLVTAGGGASLPGGVKRARVVISLQASGGGEAGESG